MNTRFIIQAIAILLMTPLFCLGQGKKTLAKNKVSSQTVYEYFIAEGMDEPVVEKREMYDTLGNRVELQEYNRDGVLKKWERYEYNEDGDMIEEVSLDDKEHQVKRIVYVIEDGFLKEKQYFDRKDRMYKRKEYVYEYWGTDH